MIIALETATDYGSVALGRNADLVGEVVIGTRTRHAESLLPGLDFLMRSAGVTRGEIRGIVVGAGPGSFTGVRIAAATARGLAAALAVPLYAYSSLAALALEVRSSATVCTVFDARRGEVYAACWDRDAGTDRLHALMEPEALAAHALRERLEGRTIEYAGDGARRYAAELGIAPPAPLHPRAATLLRLVAADPEGGRIRDMTAWEPLYLRASGAARGVAG